MAAESQLVLRLQEPVEIYLIKPLGKVEWDSLCSRSIKYTVYKSAFPDMPNPIFEFEATYIDRIYFISLNKITFNISTTQIGVLRQIDEGCCPETPYSLSGYDAQGKFGNLGSIERVKSREGGRDELVAAPYFRVTIPPINSMCLTYSVLIYCFIIFALLIALYYTLFCPDVVPLVPTIVLWVITWCAILFGLTWYLNEKCKLYCGDSTIERREQVWSSATFHDNLPYVEAHFVWFTSCERKRYIELHCYKRVDQVQLMLLASIGQLLYITAK